MRDNKDDEDEFVLTIEQANREGWKHVAFSWEPVCPVCQKIFPLQMIKQQQPSAEEIEMLGVVELYPPDLEAEAKATDIEQLSLNKRFACVGCKTKALS